MTTEWEDIQIRLGNMAPKDIPKPPTADEYDAAALEVREAFELEQKSKRMKELDEDLDDVIDDEEQKFLEEYRKKRIAELEAAAAKNRFGHLIPITEPSYKKEVTEAGPGVYVVVLLHEPGLRSSETLERIIAQLANKFKSTKFVQIRGKEAIKNYPDRNIPTVLVYYNGDVVGQWVGIRELGGELVTVKDLEWKLGKIGAIETDMEEEPAKNKGGIFYKKTNSDSSDDDSS